MAVIQLPSTMLSKLWARKKNQTYYEQDPEKVALFLKSLDSLKHLAPVYIDETGFNTYFYREYGRSLKGQLIRGKVSGRRYPIWINSLNDIKTPILIQMSLNKVFFCLAEFYKLGF